MVPNQKLKMCGRKKPKNNGMILRKGKPKLYPEIEINYTIFYGQNTPNELLITVGGPVRAYPFNFLIQLLKFSYFLDMNSDRDEPVNPCYNGGHTCKEF